MLRNRSESTAVISLDGKMTATLSLYDILVSTIGEHCMEKKKGVGLFRMKTNDNVIDDVVGITVQNILDLSASGSKEYLKVGRNSSVSEVVEIMSGNKVEALWVVEDDLPVGLISLEDVLAKFSPYDYVF